MKPPLVSVVIPSYNYGQFLRRAVDSVAAQTYAPVEVIVVDNGSTDATNEVLAGYGSAVTVLRQPIRGPSATRNMGIRAAKGRYIAFLDADDRWRPDKLSRQMELFERDPTLGAVGCGVVFVSGSGAPIGHRDFAERASDPLDLVLQLRRVAVRDFWIGGSASGALIRREVFEAVGLWDETLPSAEDWDLWMRVAAKFAIRNVPDRLVEVALHGTGTWRDPGPREGNQWRALDAALARWPEALSGVSNRMRALVLADVGGECIDAGDPKTALRKYLASLRQWPFDASRWGTAGRLAVKRLIGR